ncbi:g9766 [Coccomyxa elongata]
MLSVETARQLESCKAALRTVEEVLSRCLVQNDNDKSAQAVPLSQATEQLLMAQTVSVLYQCYLRLSGEAVEDTTHAKDMERLSIYRKKIEKVESEKWFKEHKRTLEVNVSAANRFISHAIPELTNEQRSALKRARVASTGLKGRQTQTVPTASRESAEAFLESMEASPQAESVAAGDARRIAEQSGTQQDLAASEKKISQKKRKAANGRSGKKSRSTDR